MFPATLRRRPQGRIVRIEDNERSIAVFEGRRVVVRSLRGGPLSVGDRVLLVGAARGGAIVEVRSGGARVPLLMPAPRVAPA